MKVVLSVLAICLFFGSCTINKNYMLRHDSEFVFDSPVIDSTSTIYTITPNDVLSFELFTNNGAVILEFTTSASTLTRLGTTASFDYIVDSEGYADFPVIGRTFVHGLTVAQVQDLLEDKYSFQFNSPYAKVKVLNRRVVVYNGAGANGTVVALGNNAVNVIEALALAGGIDKRGYASRVKLFRKVNGKQEVYLIDLSKIEGIKYANMTVLGGDIIYVDAVPQLGRELLLDVQPFVQLFTSMVVAYALLNRII